MKTERLLSLGHLTNQQLLARVQALSRRERLATAALVAHLAEMENRELHLAEGYSSLFRYCTQVLHLSEHAAYARIYAARLIRRFPEILRRLEESSIHLTAIGLLGPHLTEANCGDLLEAAHHRSRRDVEEIVARVRPLADVPAVVRKLPVRAAYRIAGLELTSAEEAREIARVASPGLAETVDPAVATPSNALTGSPKHASPPITPLAPERYKVQFTAGVALRDKLREVQELLRHQVPDGDLAEIVDLALTELLEKLRRRKLAATTRPRQVAVVPGEAVAPEEAVATVIAASRAIPAAVKREVWSRDGGRCAFVGRNGHRCEERGFLEFHHRRPYAAGGLPSPANIQLRCRSHNEHESRLWFGHRASDVRSTRFEPSP